MTAPPMGVSVASAAAPPPRCWPVPTGRPDLDSDPWGVLGRSGAPAVTVSDDGVGLPSDLAIEPGLGLAAVTDGLARIGGGLTVSTNDDGGVTANCWIPV